MKTPFRLDEHPRRPQPPLAPPAADYFDKLPLRVMHRVRPAAEPAPLWGWFASLSAPLRTALASVVLLLTFVGSFWLTSRPGGLPAAGVARRANAAQALAAVPRAEAVQYLLSDAAPRVTLADLADTHVAERALTADFLPGTDAEIQAALDEQPSLDVYL
ncbi:hypothetical protein [Hymenobacter jeollabukensis]|uniref:Uncharacterized protein n=1 Tax=Hymenobacter jeollabukensis TaxID=2025313 RepID=A0A5R8WMX6_9BACT|nr:hypothetical protein [Hymenobacter jeollabukensis]TLM91107.1 hypothetical protein FDY95_16050 [Hymenobacter jeollabukensis]